MIESISCSSQIIPDELDIDNNSTPTLDWVKLQRADPNLSVIIKLIESDQLFKRKLHRKDSPEVRISWPEVLSDEGIDVDLECIDTEVCNLLLNKRQY